MNQTSDTQSEAVNTTLHQSGGVAYLGSVTAETVVAGNQTTYNISEDLAHDVSGLESPYLGLNPFTYDQRGQYAGRAAEIAAALNDLTQPGAQRVLYFITGASGSGKSSFAQAGLLPALEAHYAECGTPLRRLPVVRPGDAPMARLKAAMEPLGPSDWAGLGGRQGAVPCVLVLDQFEEFFTQSPPDQRKAVFAQLAQLPPFEACRMHIIATMRSDYLDELFADGSLWAVAKLGAELRQMDEDALKDAIQRPLQSKVETDPAYLGKRFEAALVDKLAQQTAAEPSLLPLLQVTLDELWRNKRRLTLSSYAYVQNGQFVRDGTLTDAIQNRADTVLAFVDYDEPSPVQPRDQAQQTAILKLLLDLVRVSLDDDYRRDVRANRNLNVMPAAQQALARDLVHARLLSVSQTQSQGTGDSAGESITIIHESLINNWAALREGVREQRLQLQRRARFEQDVRDWLANGQSDDYLLKDLALARAQELDRTGDVALTGEPHARELLTRSQAAAEAEQQRRIQEAEDRTRRARMFTAGLAVLLIVALITSVLAVNGQRELRQERQIALNARDQAQRQARIAQSQAVAGQVYANQDRAYDLGLLLGVTAYQITHTYEARSSILSTLEHSPRLMRYGRAHPTALGVDIVVFNPNGSVMASGNEDGTVLFWDTTDPALLKPLGDPLNAGVGGMVTLAWSSNGRVLAVGGGSHLIRLWDVSDLAAPQPIGDALNGHTQAVGSLAFSPDGSLLASGGDEKAVILWDVSNPAAPRVIGEPLKEHTTWVYELAFSPDGKLLASGNGDGSLLLWDIHDRSAIKRLPTAAGHTGALNAVAFSPDGRRLASSSDDNTILIWDTSDPSQVRPISPPLRGHTSAVLDVAFSPNGHVLASSGADNQILLWNVNSGNDAQLRGSPLVGHTRIVRSLAFSPDGTVLASGSGDATVAVWNVADTEVDPPIGTPWPLSRGRVGSIAVSPNDRLLAVGGESLDVTLWEINSAPPRLVSTLKGHSRPINAVAFSPDGATLATGSEDETIQLWNVSDATSPTRLTTLAGHSVNALAYSPDGRVLASGSSDATIRLWDVKDPAAARPFGVPLIGHTNTVWKLAFSPDSRTLASVSADGTLRLWDVSNPGVPQPRGGPQLNLSQMILSVNFSPDGRTLAAGDITGNITLLDVQDPAVPKIMGEPLRGGTGGVMSLVFSPDGTLLASAGINTTLRLWDVTDIHTPRPIGALLKGHTSYVAAAAFNSTGTQLVTSGWDSQLILWETDVEAWIQRACRIAARNLTQAEWKTYIGDEPYRKTCPEWPDGV